MNTMVGHAKSIRKSLILEALAAGNAHLGGSLGMVEILTLLYGEILGKNDYFLLSNGHTAPVQYAALAEFGHILPGELETYKRFGSRLQGHPERTALPKHLHSTSGPLGEGLGQAAGIALAIQRDEEHYKKFVFVTAGDGELQEGNIWESVLFASNYALGNLILIIDRNEIQISNNTEKVMKLEPLRDKFEAFGWHAWETDGHDFDALRDAINMAKNTTDRPSVIIAHTVAGKGIASLEHDFHSHHVAVNASTAKKFLQELNHA